MTETAKERDGRRRKAMNRVNHNFVAGRGIHLFDEMLQAIAASDEAEEMVLISREEYDKLREK